ncbi:prepilin peptidase [Butyrivibrio sp. M55]|uniref:prepilin peptidase n=1 Tax=Butyrivibrio sp. M55 TaxID=1855323 RepID=UPI0008F1C3AF|nr:prepilin peptidase [Butyrivibrio sp. M55]SFU55322.1 leader peptidase (prepilin peptidase) / N-methyltransferase [Butyrivibrio sp. M55]
MIIQIVALIVLFVIAVEDIKSMNISSWKIWILAALSVGSAVFEVAMGSYDIESAAVALLPGVVLIVLYYVTGKQIGLGDGMVTLCMGPAFGIERVTLGITVAFFVSGLFSLVIIAALREKRKKSYPFIPFITAGMVVATIAQI